MEKRVMAIRMLIKSWLLFIPLRCEPAWPSGKALGRLSGRHGFDSPLRLSFPLQQLWFVDTVFVTFPRHNLVKKHRLKRLSPLPTIMQILVVTV